MAVTVEMQHTSDPTKQREVAAVIEHVLADRAGDWPVSIIGRKRALSITLETSSRNADPAVPTLPATALATLAA